MEGQAAPGGNEARRDLEAENRALRSMLRECLANTGGGWISAEVIERGQALLDQPSETTAQRLPRLLRAAATWCDQQQHYLRLAEETIAEERMARVGAMVVMKGGEETIERYEAALQSIAANTCCDTCREAAAVAKRALGEPVS